MITKLRTAPLSSTVTLDDVKTHLNIPSGNTLFDLKLSGFIETATEEAEYETGRKILTQSWSAIFDNWPQATTYGDYEAVFNIPYGMLQTIDSINYTELDGTVVTLPTTVYRVDTFRGIVDLIDGQEWPSTDLQRTSAIDIQFTCGWTQSTLPEGIKTAIMIRVADFYQNLEDIILTPGVNSVLDINAFSRTLYRYRYYK